MARSSDSGDEGRQMKIARPAEAKPSDRTHAHFKCAIKSCAKALICRLAIWGLLPINTADGLIRRISGGRHAN